MSIGSVFSKVKADVATFFSNLETSAGKFCAAFVKLFGKSPAALAVVQNFINEIAPIVVAAVGIADPMADGAVSAALATVETGLAGIQAALTAAVSGTSLVGALQAFVTQIPNTLKDLDVKNPELTALIEKISNLIVNEGAVLIPAVESWVKELAAPATPAA